MKRTGVLFAFLFTLIAATSIHQAARAQSANDTNDADATAPLRADPELLVTLMSTFLPPELDGKSFTPLASLVGSLSNGHVERGLVEWQAFVKANAQQLGADNIARIGAWLVRASLLEATPELADAADRVRFAREVTSRLRAALAELEAARQALATAKRVPVRTVVVLPYERSQAGILEVAATPLTKADLDAEIELVRDQLDSLSEMGEMESLRLQMAMDRMSKLMSTLSNLLKKLSDTASTITHNLK